MDQSCTQGINCHGKRRWIYIDVDWHSANGMDSSTAIEARVCYRNYRIATLNTESTQAESPCICTVALPDATRQADLSGKFCFTLPGFVSKHIPVAVDHPLKRRFEIAAGLHRLGRKQ